ncbi:Membrane metallo-endopeptidase-like 1 [Mycena indigotica]|uniref:Membrane metallo-endopeptidase-like 1 n=1 Tax=Mycena indigotica TaxID=2126181 RepID=A0A8H6T1F1_9AGAR|nr:Membrane metallo-endopeptidase-like 1 [Mycena indigotica]KAF7310250.1 Membrane metallo-endopeptidase-like 1 [Mycena indigotica]
MQLIAYFAALLFAVSVAAMPAPAISSAPAPSAAPAHHVQWHYGANCTDRVIETSDDARIGDCVYITQGYTGRSFSWTGATHGIEFFISGGSRDVCNGLGNAFFEETGCATAPPGVNWQSFRFLPPPPTKPAVTTSRPASRTVTTSRPAVPSPRG